MDLVIQFVVVALLSGVLLWVLGKLTLDQMIMQYIRVAIIVLLTVALINVLLILLFGKGLVQVLHGG